MIKELSVMEQVNIRLIDDDLVSYAVNVLMFTPKEVCLFTLDDWNRVLEKYDM